MHDVPRHGLTRRQLEYQLSWIMRRRPKDPAKLPEFIGEIMVTLIDRNNAALAKYAEQTSRPDLPESS